MKDCCEKCYYEELMPNGSFLGRCSIPDCPCHTPPTQGEKDPRKERLDRGINMIADNLNLSSKVLYDPSKIKQEIVEEYDKTFNFEAFCWNGDNATGEKFAKQKQKEVKRFLTSAITRIEESVRDEAAHLTEDGYCCACDYDIAGFEQEKKDAFELGKEETLREAIEAVRKLRTEFAVKDKENGYDSLAFAVIATLTAQLKGEKDV